jgi:hypothetical protein
MHSGIWTQIAGWGSLPILALLIAVSAWRTAPRQFPWFFYYLLIGLIGGLIRFFTYRHIYSIYFFTYWISDAVGTAFAFLAAYDLFAKRIFISFYKVRLYRVLFPAAACIVVTLGSLAMVQTHQSRMLASLIHAVDVIRLAMIFFFVALMIFMGRRWNQYEFGVALGLGLEASAFLFTATFWAASPHTKWIISQLPALAYDLACIVWLITFLRAPSRGVPAQPISPELVASAKQAESGMKEWLAGKKNSSE